MHELLYGQQSPSSWVARWSHLLPKGCSVLDIACGYGRHMHHFVALGHCVTGIDCDPEAITSLNSLGEAICADIENGTWPLESRTFDGVVVTNYLWRPLWPRILDSLAPNGVLIYETFSVGNESVGKPSRADFLLHPAELLAICQDLRIVAFEEGFLTDPERFVQRIVAVREDNKSQTPRRYSLVG